MILLSDWVIKRPKAWPKSCIFCWILDQLQYWKSC